MSNVLANLGVKDLLLMSNHAMCPELRSPNHISFGRRGGFKSRKLMAGHGYVRAVLHGNMEHHAAQGEHHI